MNPRPCYQPGGPVNWSAVLADQSGLLLGRSEVALCREASDYRWYSSILADRLLAARSDERLNHIMQIHRDQGVYIANPHVYRVEDGKQGQVNAVVVVTKLRFDPAGLLKPGKLRGWEQREALLSEAAAAAAGRELVSTLARF